MMVADHLIIKQLGIMLIGALKFHVAAEFGKLPLQFRTNQH